MRFAARSVALGLALLLSLFGACKKTTASGGSSTPPTTPSPSPEPVAGCPVSQGSENPVPNPDPNGPFFHHIAVAASDGQSISGPVEVLDRASVPDGVRLADGSIAVYYVNGSTNTVWVGRLSGSTLTPIGRIAIDNVSPPMGVVDPDAMLVNGRVRLAYLLNVSGTRSICIAESTDGQQFQTKAAALRLTTGSTLTDPSVVQLADGSWLMAISNGDKTVLARSGDGLTFTMGEQVTYGGVPELANTSDGRVRLYVCAAAGIDSYVSSDSGRAWTREGTIVPSGTLGRQIVCDPSFVAGTSTFIFKTQ